MTISIIDKFSNFVIKFGKSWKNITRTFRREENTSDRWKTNKTIGILRVKKILFCKMLYFFFSS